jgi:2-hydroxychromene-2-carboxylate isomerase
MSGPKLTIESFTIYHSPNAYLGSMLLARALDGLDHITLVRRPIHIPRARGVKVADLVGGRETAAMSSYHREDCRRWAERHGIPLRYIDRETFDARARQWAQSESEREELPARAYYAALGSGREAALDAALFAAAWVEGLDVNEPATVYGAAGRAGLDGDALLAAAAGDGPARQIRAALAAFDRLQCPGVPTFLLDGERFYGKDRVDWLVAACHGKRL